MADGVGHHESEYKNMMISLTLAKTIDGVLISLESFLYALEEDATRMGYKVEDEIKHYLSREESGLLLSGIRSCWNSFEYLVLETPRFKLIRKYYDLIKNELEGRTEIRSDKTFECISPPALWRKEGEGREQGYVSVTTSEWRVRPKKYSWVEIAIVFALSLSLIGALLKLVFG